MSTVLSLLNRYVVRQLSSATVYALLALVSLYLFFDIIGEIGDVGEHNYTSSAMLQYVAMQIPARAYELMPLAVLVGGLIAMSQLATHSELTVMKTSGLSPRRLGAMMLQFGGLFALLTLLLGEWAVPALGQKAEQFKLNATHNNVSAGAQSGIWIKQHNDIINIAEMLPDATLRGITIYRHNDDFQLTQMLKAESARIDPARADGAWQLQAVARSELGVQTVTTSTLPSLEWPAAVNRQLLGVLLVKPEQMSIQDLGSYVRHLQQNQQQTARYELAWWRKISYPLAALVMAWVALAFTPQHTRHGNMGLRLFFGICLGLAFHFAGRLFGFSSQLYGIPPVVAALLPTLLFALLAVWLIRRQARR